MQIIKKIKKAKGVNKNVVKNIGHKEYIDIWFNKNLIRHIINGIQSKLHRIATYDVCKMLCLVLIIRDIFLMMVRVQFKFSKMILKKAKSWSLMSLAMVGRRREFFSLDCLK